MKASADNVFVGATVTKNNENFLVVKVNTKSMYVVKGWTFEQYNSAFNLKEKNVTFKDFCKKNNIEMISYSDFEIEESEAAKKAVIEDSKKAKNTVSVFGKAEKMVLLELIKYKKLHRFANIQVGDKIMRAIEAKDNDKILLNIDNEYILYNLDLDVAYDVCSVYDWGKKVSEIPWDKITPKLAVAD